MAMTDSALLGRLAARLGPKGLITDPQDIAPWLHDWRGRYHGASPAIVAPASTLEAADAIRMAGEAGVPLVPQGGNTSMVGGATPPADGGALILSTRRMNRIRSISPEDNLAIAEAGVILSDLHDAVEAQGRRFPLTLSAKGSATIGGLTSTNAGGTQVLRFGTMRALVAGVEAVLPDGSIFDGLSPLKKDNRGYDLKQLLIGAEGTLGLITAVALRLAPAVPDRAVAWVGLQSPQVALALLRRLERALPESIESFELVPADSLALVLKHIPGTRAPLAGAWPWNALIEHVGPAGTARAALEEALAGALAEGLGNDAVVASSHAQEEALWHLRHSISEAERADGPATQHDISVPVAAMPDFMVAAAAAIEAEYPGAHATAFGHLGDGNVHFHVRAPAGAARDWVEGEGKAASRRVYDMVVAAGGSISAEHGIGQMKLDELERLSDPGRLAALRAIKHALDPAGIMNPGKLVRLAPGTPTP
ncbi:MAG: hydroxyacid dehydrogenase [Sphingomonas sanxanigenens]|uniref:Hydroxyacid dehydrogenase n=1 Tax=Sphingomonas sanxanigenens TaxID=397260 RepID=A0A2W5AFS5_9SPHN|nr:MAG: hydroxyacid dehydrogenase [Sphingomonas sanxanigenens]